MVFTFFNHVIFIDVACLCYVFGVDTIRKNFNSNVNTIHEKCKKNIFHFNQMVLALICSSHWKQSRYIRIKQKPLECLIFHTDAFKFKHEKKHIVTICAWKLKRRSTPKYFEIPDIFLLLLHSCSFFRCSCDANQILILRWMEMMSESKEKSHWNRNNLCLKREKVQLNGSV